MPKFSYVTDAANSRIFANTMNRDDQVKYSLEMATTGPRRTPIDILRYGIVYTKPRLSLPAGVTDQSLAQKTTDTVRISVSGDYATHAELFARVDKAVALFKAGQVAASNRFLLGMNAEPEYTDA